MYLCDFMSTLTLLKMSVNVCVCLLFYTVCVSQTSHCSAPVTSLSPSQLAALFQLISILWHRRRRLILFHNKVRDTPGSLRRIIIFIPTVTLKVTQISTVTHATPVGH